MAAIHHPLDIYKVPRASVNVEALAQEFARYLQMTGEDTEVLSQDPTRRDKLIAELYQQPGVKPNHYPTQFVGPNGDPDEYLVPANAEIAKLTPPKSFEDRIMRLHIAFPAMMVFHQYKIAYALLDLPDLQRKVKIRKTQIMSEWRRTVFNVRFPPRSFGLVPSESKAPSTPPTQPRLPTPPPSRYSPKRVSEDQLISFLNNPHTMIGKPFVHGPPQDQDQEDRGTWEVVSYTVKKVDCGVDHEFQILLYDKAFGADPVVMDMEEIRSLLQASMLRV